MYSTIRAQVRPISSRFDCRVAPKSGRDTAEGENFALTGKTEEVGDWTSRVSTTIVVKFYCTPPAPAVSQLAKSARAPRDHRPLRSEENAFDQVGLIREAIRYPPGLTGAEQGLANGTKSPPINLTACPWACRHPAAAGPFQQTPLSQAGPQGSPAGETAWRPPPPTS